MTLDLKPGDWIELDTDHGHRTVRVVKATVEHPAGDMILFAGGDAISTEEAIHRRAERIPRPLREPYSRESIFRQQKEQAA